MQSSLIPWTYLLKNFNKKEIDMIKMDENFSFAACETTENKEVTTLPAKINGPKIIRFASLSAEETRVETNYKITRDNIWKGLLPLQINVRESGVFKPTLFSCHLHALRHINKHMLRKEEGALWVLMCPEVRESINLMQNRTVNHRAQDALIPIAILQVLYNAYAGSVEKAINEAVRYNCFTGDSTSSYYLGLNGLLVIIDRGIVKTAYFPSFNDSSATSTPRKYLTLKDKRELRIRNKAKSKRNRKGTSSRRLYQHGFRSTLRYFAQMGNSNRSSKLYAELLTLAEKNMPESFYKWEVAA
jgi:hypothetical protein